MIWYGKSIRIIKFQKRWHIQKKTEWENRTWDVLAQGNDWIVWEGENGFLHRILQRKR